MDLKGIAWNHTRGFTSVAATAQRFEELNPDIRIQWEKRSLQAFADAPIEELSRQYDIMVMDHPHTALAARKGLLLPLDEWLESSFLRELEEQSVGASHASYAFENHQWTLATDAAAPIATWRPDIFARENLTIPETWEDVLELAKAGYVTMSLYPLDVLMHLYTFCQAQGVEPFGERGTFANEESVRRSLEEFKKLARLCDPECLERNPIRTAEYMSTSDNRNAAYCPFAYGYSNYSRPGYAQHLLHAGNLVSWQGKRLHSCLGGAGLAISSQTKHPEASVRYAAFNASLEVQKGIYFAAGGQPGHRQAWLDPEVNQASSHFFQNTLQTLDEALLRPQFPGYMRFQDEGTEVVASFMEGKITSKKCYACLNDLCSKTSESTEMN